MDKFTDRPLLIGYGASTMEGVGDPQGGFFRRVGDLLREKKLPRDTLNLGIGGWTTNDMLAGVPRLPNDRPYDLIVLIGSNDMPRANDSSAAKRLPLDAYRANLQKLLPMIRGRNSLFVASFLVSQEKTGISPAVFDEYMTAAMELAQAAGYDIWDLYSQTRDTVAPLLAPDGMHFNAAGHALIATTVAERVMMWKD